MSQDEAVIDHSDSNTDSAAQDASFSTPPTTPEDDPDSDNVFKGDDLPEEELRSALVEQCDTVPARSHNQSPHPLGEPLPNEVSQDDYRVGRGRSGS